MEGIETPRPLTHDLFKSFTDALGGEVSGVHIHNLVEGVFYAKVILTNVIDSYEVECTIGDAISLALLYKCPIVASSVVMDTAGIYMSDEGVITDEQKEMNHKERDTKEMVSVESLEVMLQKAVDNEEFEIASQLRDRINQLKSN
jgi:bifunctional DNase/RNase